MYEEKESVLQKVGLGLPVDGKGLGPNAARSSEDWHYFRLYHKEHNPIRYFLNNDFESIFIWPWSMRLQRLTDWVKYRTTRRYHIVNTGMEPGYSDVSERMLHVNFNMLKDFVEIEKAHMYEVFVNNGVTGNAAGVAHLMWEMGLEEQEEFGNNQQAKNAREIYDLYNWWIDERPLRVEPMETPEHNAYWKLRTKEDEKNLIRLMKIRDALWT